MNNAASVKIDSETYFILRAVRAEKGVMVTRAIAQAVHKHWAPQLKLIKNRKGKKCC
ncbi:MAG: hypothetical protein HZB36_01060 [Candidatus Omnitrophica bacterium]|nr:hypothetical protein [Candidatus Omnitrophota bacterium]